MRSFGGHTVKGNQNSQAQDDFVLHLCRQISSDLSDIVERCYDHLESRPFNLDKEKRRDEQTVERRLRDEGLGFATKTLPLLGKWLDARLGGKLVQVPEQFGVTELPCFLRRVWHVIFVDPCPDDQLLARVIRLTRTLCYGFYKLSLPFTEEQVNEKLNEFLETEKEVALWEPPVTNNIVLRAQLLLDAALRKFDTSRRLEPKHGPGAVATGEKNEQKWVFTHLYDSLHQRFPYYDFMYGIRTNGVPLQLLDRVKRYKSMKRFAYPTAKLVFVPKDSRGPRIISSEPLELQFIQQAVAYPLMDHIQKDELTGGYVNFTDQSINGKLALENSRTGEYATLDLSEASDRVSLALFRLLWPKRLLADFEALRSHATRLPDGSEVSLSKFAPMGSALCFPVESLLFWALCVSALEESGDRHASCHVYVYGDDIIVPTDKFDVVAETLHTFGLKVNVNKSFFAGNFRESCGVDAWKGYNVTPVRFRKFPGTDPSDATAHAAWCAYASHLNEIGALHAAAFARTMVTRVLGWIPTTSRTMGYLSFVDPWNVSGVEDYPNVKWDTDSCCLTAKLWVLKTPKRELQLDSWERLALNLHGCWLERDPSEVVARTATQIAKRRIVIETPLSWVRRD